MQPRRGYRDRVTTPGDESRTELAWREIVENYGERPVLPDDLLADRPADQPAGSPDDRPESAGDDAGGEARADAADPGTTTYDERPDDLDESEDTADEIPEVDRFRPPAAPPFPRPRTWQRGLAWAGLFVAPVLALMIVVFSLGLPNLVGWLLVVWFVGGFLYLVREMPRSPRDPWDDGSRI